MVNEFELVKVQNTNQVSTIEEITLYLNGYDRLTEWFNFININLNVYESERMTLHSDIQKLPSHDDLVAKSEKSQTMYYYMTYTDSPEGNRCNRKTIFMNLGVLLKFMFSWKLQFEKALPEEKRSEYGRIYNLTLSAFNDWMEVARPFIVPLPLLSMLRKREQSGHRFKRVDVSGRLSVLKSLVDTHL